MIKLTVSALTVLSTLTSVAAAESCTSGLMYCGYNLIRKGNYRSEIEAELVKYGLDTDRRHVGLSLFKCGIGGNEGWIGFDDYCLGGCVDGGHGKSDYCNWS